MSKTEPFFPGNVIKSWQLLVNSFGVLAVFSPSGQEVAGDPVNIYNDGFVHVFVVTFDLRNGAGIQLITELFSTPLVDASLVGDFSVSQPMRLGLSDIGAGFAGQSSIGEIAYFAVLDTPPTAGQIRRFASGLTGVD